MPNITSTPSASSDRTSALAPDMTSPAAARPLGGLTGFGCGGGGGVTGCGGRVRALRQDLRCRDVHRLGSAQVFGGQSARLSRRPLDGGSGSDCRAGNKKAHVPDGTGLAHTLQVKRVRLAKYSGEAAETGHATTLTHLSPESSRPISWKTGSPRWRSRLTGPAVAAVAAAGSSVPDRPARSIPGSGPRRAPRRRPTALREPGRPVPMALRRCVRTRPAASPRSARPAPRVRRDHPGASRQPDGFHDLPLRRVAYALRDHLEIEPRAELHDDVDEWRHGPRPRAAGRITDERAVDLEDVDRQLAELAERGVAGAEVVESDPDTGRPQLGQTADDGVEVERGGVLGHLDHQTIGLDVMDAQRLGDLRRRSQGRCSSRADTFTESHRL